MINKIIYGLNRIEWMIKSFYDFLSESQSYVRVQSSVFWICKKHLHIVDSWFLSTTTKKENLISEVRGAKKKKAKCEIRFYYS